MTEETADPAMTYGADEPSVSAVCETGDTSESPKRGRPGRKPGSPKVPGSGRKAGARNKVTADVKADIMLNGRPLATLYAVTRGQRMKVADPSNPKRAIFAYPSLGDRVNAARTLLAKCIPDMKAQELSGPDGGPIRTADDAASQARDHARAAHVMALLKAADNQPVEEVALALGLAGDGEEPTERESLREALFRVATAIRDAKAAGESTDRFEAIHATLKRRWDEMRTRAPVASQDTREAPAATSATPEGEMRAGDDPAGNTSPFGHAPLSPGYETTIGGIGGVVVRNLGPDRPGLPNRIAVLRAGAVVRMFGEREWPDAVLRFVKDRLGIEGEMTTPRPVPGMAPTIRSDQYA